jgi:hypothetical protein
MQQLTKKRSPREMAARAYDYFRQAEKNGRVLTEVEICRYTGYSLTTMRKHLSTKWRKRFLHGDRSTGFTVNGLIGHLTKSEFLQMHRQSIDKPVPALKPPVVIEKPVEYYYTIRANSAEMWLIVAGLIVAGIWWKKS